MNSPSAIAPNQLLGRLDASAFTSRHLALYVLLLAGHFLDGFVINVTGVAEVAGIPVQWAELGGHGGGRLADFRAAARVLAGQRVHPSVKFNLVPSSREVFTEAAREGLVLALHEAGATWFPPGTGSNQAINMGALAENEAMISTHARNFPGRNGSPRASMYLASAATVAASAVTGTITGEGSI